MSILNVEHLTHGFGDRAIFSDVSFRLLKRRTYWAYRSKRRRKGYIYEYCNWTVNSKDTEKNKIMKINEQWEELREKSHANIQE